MADVASLPACAHDETAMRARLYYSAVAVTRDIPASIDPQLETPLQPFLLRESRRTPVWIITRR